jgi:hypothetical protein
MVMPILLKLMKNAKLPRLGLSAGNSTDAVTMPSVFGWKSFSKKKYRNSMKL